jgi:hypothetical protein
MDALQSDDSTATSAEGQNGHPRLTPTPPGRISAGRPTAPRAGTGAHDGKLRSKKHSGKGKQKATREGGQSTTVPHLPPVHGHIIGRQDEGPRGESLQQGSASGTSGDGSEQTAPKKSKKKKRNKKSKEPQDSPLESVTVQPPTSGNEEVKHQDNQQLSSPTGVSPPNTTNSGPGETGDDISSVSQEVEGSGKKDTARNVLEGSKLAPTGIVVTPGGAPQLGTQPVSLHVAPSSVVESRGNSGSAKEIPMEPKKNKGKQTCNPQQNHDSTASRSIGSATVRKIAVSDILNPDIIPKSPMDSSTGVPAP